jgi:hypothetical protein
MENNSFPKTLEISLPPVSSTGQTLPLSPAACLRVAASAEAGERAGVRGQNSRRKLLKLKHVGILNRKMLEKRKRLHMGLRQITGICYTV